MEDLHPEKFVKTYIALMQYVVSKPATAELREMPQIEEYITMSLAERQAVIEEVQDSMQTENK